jgi:hypothetical protein
MSKATFSEMFGRKYLQPYLPEVSIGLHDLIRSEYRYLASLFLPLKDGIKRSSDFMAQTIRINPEWKIW